MSGLTRRQYIVIFAIALAVFLFANGRLWRHPFDVDRAVWWSYAVIPPLVAGFLYASGRFRVRGLVLGTLELILYKFGATYLIAATLWALSKPPPRPPLSIAPAAARARPDTPAPIPNELRANLRG